MDVKTALGTCILAAIALMGVGCPRHDSSPTEPKTNASGGNTVILQVTDPEEHLLHSIDEQGHHAHWYDGCRGKVAPSGRDLLIWWENGAIQNTDFVFLKDRTYIVDFKGEFGDDFVEREGKSLHVGQILRVRKKTRDPARSGAQSFPQAVIELNRQIAEFNRSRDSDMGISPIVERVDSVDYNPRSDNVLCYTKSGAVLFTLERQAQGDFRGTHKVEFHELPKPEGHAWGSVEAGFTLDKKLLELPDSGDSPRAAPKP